MSQDLNELNAEKLRKIRLRIDKTQAEFAPLIPVDRAYLSELENARQTVQEWILDKAEKIEREHVANLNISHAPLPSRQTAPGVSDLPLVLEALASGLDANSLMGAVQRISADARISVGAKALSAELLSARARTAPAVRLPAKIHGLNSALTAAQRAAAAKQQALARSASPKPSPSPKAGAPSAGKGPRGRGTASRRKSRRSPQGQAQA